jgi:hypothetical protein
MQPGCCWGDRPVRRALLHRKCRRSIDPRRASNKKNAPLRNTTLRLVRVLVGAAADVRQEVPCSQRGGALRLIRPRALPLHGSFGRLPTSRGLFSPERRILLWDLLPSNDTGQEGGDIHGDGPTIKCVRVQSTSRREDPIGGTRESERTHDVRGYHARFRLFLFVRPISSSGPSLAPPAAALGRRVFVVAAAIDPFPLQSNTSFRRRERDVAIAPVDGKTACGPPCLPAPAAHGLWRDAWPHRR